MVAVGCRVSYDELVCGVGVLGFVPVRSMEIVLTYVWDCSLVAGCVFLSWGRFRGLRFGTWFLTCVRDEVGDVGGIGWILYSLTLRVMVF